MSASGRLLCSTLAVIGTAGRGSDAKQLTPELYDHMYEKLIETLSEWQVASVASGGAAYADHLAVRAFLDGYCRELLLLVPAPFDGKMFIPNPSVQFNPGRTLNHYHEAFSRTCGVDSRKQLAKAIAVGAKVSVVEGFHNRNMEVARAAELLVAFTFGNKNSRAGNGEVVSDFYEGDAGFDHPASAGLKDGGTAHTWSQASKVHIKRHYNLWKLRQALDNDQYDLLSV